MCSERVTCVAVHAPDTVAAALEGGTAADLECSLFGFTVEIPDPGDG